MASAPEKAKEIEKHVEKKQKTHMELLDTIITIQVGQGASQKTFGIHKGLLCDVSPVFKAQLEGDCEEAEQKYIRMPDEDVEVLKRFQLWIYHQIIIDVDETIEGLNWNQIIGLYIFAEARDIPKLQNATINIIADKFTIHNTTQNKRLKMVYENTRMASPLRRMFVDFNAHRGDMTLKGLFDNELGREMPSEYLRDLIVVLFKRCPDYAPIEFLQKRRETYHVPISE